MIPYRVLIIDDHPLARLAIRSVLEDSENFEVCGEAATGEEGMACCEREEPELVLMDIQMPGMDGLETARRIKRRFPNIKIVMLTVSDDTADLFAALQYGAQGYLLKNMDPAEWTGYLIDLCEEQGKPTREWSDRLFRRFRQGDAHADPGQAASDEVFLTQRELEIVQHVARGETNRGIAERLCISENTVKNHLKNIMDKCKVDNRTQLTAFAVRNGWAER
ncbi:DNA-binding response regulator [Xylanibacillus composti]|uniref:DNA-binding response regulator n=1 Tax=Xylanibacillus composti TaxID=1572762 RepID=A0A8J4GZ27_9BACL|nr:response regulator transcription factor [Xylanibacillus composti]MDT9723992.1 DNA-binding response regulator [Xylanibacillus composti]GIQ67873.1 DNA-binding response regulator [Xylanibacillus composti]